jgi:hypothetical protein
MFGDGQAYVALSRVEKSNDLNLTAFCKSAFKTNYDIVYLLRCSYAEMYGTIMNFHSSSLQKTIYLHQIESRKYSVSQL